MFAATRAKRGGGEVGGLKSRWAVPSRQLKKHREHQAIMAFYERPAAR